jgi:S-adenosylmethionine:tRNA ribosyltransferase-isomerase
MTAALPSLEVPATDEAHVPPEARGLARDGVRLLVASLPDGRVRHAHFRDLPHLLTGGDVLVLNTSATVPAALRVRRASGADAVLHLSTPVPGLEETDPRRVVELRSGAGPARDARTGELLALPDDGRAELLARYVGRRLWVAELCLPEALPSYLARHGRPISYAHVHGSWSLEAYQTV